MKQRRPSAQWDEARSAGHFHGLRGAPALKGTSAAGGGEIGEGEKRREIGEGESR